MHLAEKLIQLRKQHGWTQAVAAREIDIQQSYLSKLENGRFIPSDEVIDKLCKAYQVPKTELVTAIPSEQPVAKYWIFGVLAGLILLISGYFGLVYNQTYYTYRATPVSDSESVDAGLSFHLTDQYNGERYVTTFDGVTYDYELIAERDVLRKENRWLMTSGLILALMSIGFAIVRMGLRS